MQHIKEIISVFYYIEDSLFSAINEILRHDTGWDINFYIPHKTSFTTQYNMWQPWYDVKPENVRVVILGQSPYSAWHYPTGRAFATGGVKMPDSLKNIDKELRADLGVTIGDDLWLDHWAAQGVMLLNRALVDGSMGDWDGLIKETLRTVSSRGGVVFLLWGSKAQALENTINKENNLILTTSHPSPLSAHRGFLGCGHFSRANEFLGDRAINWGMPC